jgi:hypothetical protein
VKATRPDWDGWGRPRAAPDPREAKPNPEDHTAPSAARSNAPDHLSFYSAVADIRLALDNRGVAWALLKPCRIGGSPLVFFIVRAAIAKDRGRVKGKKVENRI